MSAQAAAGLAPQSLIDCTQDIGDPPGVREGAALLLEAARDGRAGVICDYDVDGATSQAILVEALRKVAPRGSPDPAVAVPDQNTEGFGPNDRCLQELAQAGATCVAVLDCGTASGQLLDRFQADTGIAVLVIDHHPPHGLTPPRLGSLVNPWVSKAPDPGQHGTLCAAGLSWFVGRSILRQSGLAQADVRSVLQHITLLAALGTSCDMMRLDTPFNRSLIRLGVRLLSRREILSPGLAGICEATGLKGEPTADDLNWRIGPRLNAGRRMGESDLAARCLRERDPVVARKLAEQLDDYNRARKALGQKAERELESSENSASFEKGPVNLHVLESATPGTVGLAASSLVKRFGWPAIVLTKRRGTSLSGSGRSALEFNLGAAVSTAREEGILTHGGGHAKACGVELDASQVSAFRAFLHRTFREHASRNGGIRQPTHVIDAVLGSEHLSNDSLMAIAEAQDRLAPWGQGLKFPLFGARRCSLARRPRTKNRHVFMTLGSGPAEFEAVWWGAPEDWAERLGLGENTRARLRRGPTREVDVVGYVELDEWQGRRNGRFVVRNARASAK